MFNEEKTEAIPFVDAPNAFNALNQKATLHKIQLTCSELSTYMINIYHEPANLVEPILGQERTTQVDVPA